MDLASTYYLGITLLFCAIFAVIVLRTYHPQRKEQGERAKFRMMDDGDGPGGMGNPKEDRR